MAGRRTPGRAVRHLRTDLKVLEPGTITNVSTVEAEEEDTNPTNNTDDETITVTPAADLAIAKLASSSTAVVGDQVTYRLTVTNLGPDPATGVTATDETIPTQASTGRRPR